MIPLSLGGAFTQVAIFILVRGLFKLTMQSYAYLGEFLYGKRHGKGTYYFANGDKWKGTWREDSQHGKGVWL
jgi:hypothetical protein